MSYSSRIKQKHFAWGGTALFATFPTHGHLSITGSITGGARLAQGAVVADLHADMLLEGTKMYDKSDIQKMLDAMGASLTFAADKDRLTFSARVSKSHASALLALIVEALLEPTFPETELEHLKSRTRAELAMEAQQTNAQASINMSRLLYDKSHPNYRSSTVETLRELEKVSRAQLVSYHEHAIDGSSLVISIAGDIMQDAAFKLVEKNFSKLPQIHLSLPIFKKAAAGVAKKISKHIEDKSSIDYLLAVATGINKNHADYPALALGLQILGNPSGFTGRLMKTVREIEGLTYGTYAYLSGFKNADGHLLVYATFAPELFTKGKKAIMREIKSIIDTGVSDEEVHRHRTMFEARSRVTVSNSASLAHVAHDVIVEGHPLTYLDTFPKQILKLTASQVNKALKKYLVIKNLSESSAGPV